MFSQHDNGQFIYAITLPQLLIQLGTLGWLNLIRREVARRSEMPPGFFNGFVRRSIQVPMIPVLLLGVGLALYAVLGGAERNLYLCVAAITVVYAVVVILREYLIALGMPAFSIAASEALPFVFAGVSIWLVRPGQVDVAAFFFLLGLLASCAVQLPVVVHVLKPHLQASDVQFETAAWMRAGGMSLLGVGGRTILDRLDTLVLATLGPVVQFAQYNSAQRATVLLLVAPMVLLPVFSPHVSRAFALGDKALLRREMLLQMLLVAASVLPLAWLLVMFPAQVMGLLFGEQYVGSSPILGLIVLSQLLFAFSLPWSNLMLMTDREGVYAGAHLAVLAVVLPIAIGLVGNWGAYAIALAALIANVLLCAVFFGVGVYGLLRDEPGTVREIYT
ncbi:lipopolysaccharide biosynthesis protein [Herbaspirillum sp. NPDC087042]|uniref:lipopolysaccharide biosynthesis protein n=1 Tax=Herbaspirillum sp. NPDC087042 TaxID=3364004 RepID=UPI003818399B